MILCFDTSSLAGLGVTADKISQVRLLLEGYDTSIKQWPAGFGSKPTLGVVSANPANPAALAISDYGTLGSTLLSDEIAFDDWQATNPNVLALTAGGISQVSLDGTTKLGIRWSNDRLGVAPTWASNQTGFLNARTDQAEQSLLPILEITYTTIAVQTDPATNVTGYSAQLNGTLTDDGSDTPVYCSFEWGLTTAYGDTTLGEPVAESATFSKVIGNNLVPGTTYHFRAKAVGASGATVYGADRTFNSLTQADSLIRVQGIVHRFAAGENGQPGVYEMEQSLGGLSSQFIPPLQSKKAMPTIETEQKDWTKQNTGTQMTQREALYQYFVWGNTHTRAEKAAIFKYIAMRPETPTFAEWWAWYKVYGTGAF